MPFLSGVRRMAVPACVMVAVVHALCIALRAPLTAPGAPMPTCLITVRLKAHPQRGCTYPARTVACCSRTMLEGSGTTRGNPPVL